MKSQDSEVELGKRASGTATVVAQLKSFRTAGQPQQPPVPKQCGTSAIPRDCTPWEEALGLSSFLSHFT